MKKIIFSLSVIISGLCAAQAGIDKRTSTNTSVSLEFGEGQNKGIILPYVTSTTDANTAGAVDGTIILDRTNARIMAKQNGTWKDFSLANGSVNASIQTGLTDNVALKTIIGKTSDTTPGVLVLAETNKAMILPKETNPHLSIKNPAAGMMVYDKASKSVAFFNGSVWTFWK